MSYEHSNLYYDIILTLLLMLMRSPHIKRQVSLIVLNLLFTFAMSSVNLLPNLLKDLSAVTGVAHNIRRLIHMFPKIINKFFA